MCSALGIAVSYQDACGWERPCGPVLFTSIGCSNPCRSYLAETPVLPDR